MNKSKHKSKKVDKSYWLERFLVKCSSYFGILSLMFNKTLYQKYPKITFFLLIRYLIFILTLNIFVLFFVLEKKIGFTFIVLILLVTIMVFNNKLLSKVRFFFNLIMLSALIFVIFFVML